MGRRAAVRYWQSRRGFYCTHKGRQVLLAAGPDDSPDGPTYATARRKFSELTCPDPWGHTFRGLAEKYQKWLAERRRPKTVAFNTSILGIIIAGLGDKWVSGLLPYDVDCWCQQQKSRRGWGDSTVRAVLTVFESCLRWSVRQGLIPKNPVGSLDKPAEVSRGIEVILSPDAERKAIGGARGKLRPLVQAMRDTGARPGELIRATATDYDERLNAIVYEGNRRRGQGGHKTDRTGKARVIYLRGETTDNVKRLCRLHPTGPLFRCSRRASGDQKEKQVCGWTSAGLNSAFVRLRKRTGLKNLIPYSFRHTFAVNWLRDGRPIEALAEVLGTSIKMIEKHYGHLAEQTDYLRRLVDDFGTGSEG